MKAERLRLRFGHLLKALLENVGDRRMDLSAPTFQNTRISRVPYQRMFESVDGLGEFAAAEYKLGPGKFIESILQFFVRHSGNRADELVGELTSDYSTHLRHFSDGCQSI